MLMLQFRQLVMFGAYLEGVGGGLVEGGIISHGLVSGLKGVIFIMDMSSDPVILSLLN